MKCVMTSMWLNYWSLLENHIHLSILHPLSSVLHHTSLSSLTATFLSIRCTFSHISPLHFMSLSYLLSIIHSSRMACCDDMCQPLNNTVMCRQPTECGLGATCEYPILLIVLHYHMHGNRAAVSWHLFYYHGNRAAVSWHLLYYHGNGAAVSWHLLYYHGNRAAASWHLLLHGYSWITKNEPILKTSLFCVMQGGTVSFSLCINCLIYCLLSISLTETQWLKRWMSGFLCKTRNGSL